MVNKGKSKEENQCQIDAKDYKKYVSKPSSVSQKVFSKDFVAIFNF